MIKLPIDNQWRQANNSDKFGSLAYSRNINLDEDGYLKLSPRAVSVINGTDTSGFALPMCVLRPESGLYLIGTVDHDGASDGSAFDLDMDNTTVVATENSGTDNPSFSSTIHHAIFWQNLWFASLNETVFSREPSAGASGTWTQRISGLTSGSIHYLAVFGSRAQLCVSNKNVVKQYNTSYSGTTDLTIPADYEITGMAYNNARMGVITRLGTSTVNQNIEARFFLWDGGTTAALADAALGSDSGIAICAYKSSFAVLTRNGQLLYWNGGGFELLDAFPFYYQNKFWGSVTSGNQLRNLTFGASMDADGDDIHINAGFKLNSFNRKDETILQGNPSGVWCYNPKNGLHHKYSPSISKTYTNSVTDANVNTSTDLFTITSGTIPATGNVARFTQSTNGLGGLSVNYDYYILKVSSTTFRLAETKAQAIAGDYIDITSKGSGGTNYFWMFDLTDYGNTYHNQTGAIGTVGESLISHRDIVFGGDYPNTALTNVENLCAIVPFLENKGYAVTPKIFASQVTDSNQKMFIKFRQLKSTDSIVVKARNIDVLGLPITSSGDSGTWTGDKTFYTSQDLSEAKTYIDNGGNLECELVAGAGGGDLSQIVSINEDDDVYSVTLKDEILGAASDLKCEFIIQNWEVKTTITSDNKKGYAEVPVSKASSWEQFKIILIGDNVTIEEVQIINQPHKQSA